MKQAYDQPTNAPTTKVTAATIGGAATVVAVYLVQQIFNITITAEVASSITTLAAFLFGYIIRDKA